MFYVKDNNIVMTKGDSGIFNVKLHNKDGSQYSISQGDTLTFSVKKKKEGYSSVVIKKQGEEIVFTKEDTENIPSGKYFYDVMILRSAGERYTVIEGIFELRKAVHEFE